jgi:hypothetical protein
LEGLEVSVLKLSEVWEENETKRFDPEFFKKEAQLAYSRLKHHRRFADLVKEGYRVIYENTESIEREEGLPLGLPFFLQAADLETPFIHDEGMACVAESDWERYPKGRIQPGEILIEVKGKAEKVAIVPDDFPMKTLVTGTCYKLQVKDPLDKHLLVSFLICRYGQALKERLKTNLLISFISKEDLYSLPVPQFGNDLKRRISEAFIKSQQRQRDSFEHQKEAEQTLLRALGLEGWEPPEPLTYTRRASEALAATRLDAEHFRPKFAALLAQMGGHGEVVRLGDCVRFCERGRQPQYAEEGLPVINSRHVRANNVVLDEDNRFATEDAAQLKLDEEDRFTIKQGDLLINGTGVGTMGRCAPYVRDDKALPDNHVTILRMKPEMGLDPIFLSVQLNSIIGQMQVEQYFKGSSGQIELYPSEIKEFRIWLAPPKIQQQIKSHLEQAHHSRQEAQDLLARAKRAVEVAIEEGEERAQGFLKS